MDVMKIRSGIMRKLVSKYIANFIRDKFGYNVEVYLDLLEIELSDTKGTIRLNSEFKMPREQINGLVDYICKD